MASAPVLEKRKIDTVVSKKIEPPLKKIALDDDVLDLSRKPSGFLGSTNNSDKKVDDDIILLSEDEDDTLLETLCVEMEKENSPDPDLMLKSKALLRKLENELRNEETTLLLLQQLRDNQRSNSAQLKGNQQPQECRNVPTAAKAAHTSVQGRSAPTPPTRVAPNTQTPRTPQVTPTNNAASNSNPSSISGNKVSKSMAAQSLEQQHIAKKTALQKNLSRTLDRVALPRPPSGTGLSEVAFVPSTLTNEFTAMLGLEETVSALMDFDAFSAEKTDQTLACEPFVCSRCHTDFTPVWKRRRPGSSEVVCESCIVDSQRSTIHKSYHNVVNAALKHHAAAEREAEQEYQDTLNTPSKFEAFLKDQERKLASTHPPTQQHVPQPQTTSNPAQRYQQTNAQQPQSFQTQNTFAGSRHSSTTSMSNATAVHFTIPAVNARRQNTNTLVTSASAPSLATHQQQQQQFASQYQQLSKVVAAVAAGNSQAQSSYSVANNPTNLTAGLMMAAAANPMLLAAAAANATSQQQQQQQQVAAVAALQQRLAAAAALGEFQQSQQTQPSGGTQSSPLDQFTQLTQMQALLMNGLLCNAANQSAGNRQQQQQQQQQQMLQQALLHYTYLLQQQQAAAQAQQQQANAAALHQLMGGAASNPAAVMTLLTNLCNLNAASNAGAKK